MTYRFDKKPKKNKIVVTIFFIAFCLIIFFWPILRPALYQGTEPITKRLFQLLSLSYVVPDFVEVYFSTRTQLMHEREDMRNTIERLENKIIEQDLLLREYAYSYESSSTTKHIYPPIVTSALAKDITSIYSTLLFSKGYKDGIEVGASVYLRGRNVVCTIKEVYTRTSLCELFSGYGQKVEAVTASSGVVLTLEGRGGYFITSIVRDTPLVVGEKVLFMKDQTFVLGEITSIVANDQDTSWHALVKSGYNPTVSSLYYIETINK